MLTALTVNDGVGAAALNAIRGRIARRNYVVNDAHVHIWRQRPPHPEYVPASCARFRASTSRLVRLMDTFGVMRAAIVTPRAMGSDNRLTLAAARSAPDRLVPIGALDVCSDNAVMQAIRELHEGLAGVRINLLEDSTARGLTRSIVGKLWDSASEVGAAVQVVAGSKQYRIVSALAKERPTVRLVIEHLGRPDVRESRPRPKFRRFLQLASHENIFVKTANNGFFSRSGPPFLDLLPFYRDALAAFGPERVLWGSDWPVCLAYGSYDLAKEPLYQAAQFLTAEERSEVFQTSFERVFSWRGKDGS